MKKSSMYFWKWFAGAVVLVLLGLWWWTSQLSYAPYPQIPATQPNETDQVTVEANAETIQTASSALGTVVGGSTATALPLSTRNYTNLLSMSAGANAMKSG